jgi:transposase
MGKGRRNKVSRPTPARVKYIIRAKNNNISSRIIAIEMKVSIRTVNRVWGHWMKNREPLTPGKFWRSKTSLSEADKLLILEIMLISISKSFDAVEASTKSKILAQYASKQWSSTNTAGTYPTMLSSLVHIDGHTSKINGKEVCVVLDDSN